MNAKTAGYMLLVLSTAAASIFASRIPIMVVPFFLSMLAMAISLWLVRRRPGTTAVVRTAGSGDDFDFLSAVDRIVSTLDDLLAGRNVSLRKVHDELDRLVEGDVFEFAEAREQLIASHGFAVFARVMSEFSPAERALNRAWSAAVDGYPEEVGLSLELARERFRTLNESMKSLMLYSGDRQEALRRFRT